MNVYSIIAKHNITHFIGFIENDHRNISLVKDTSVYIDDVVMLNSIVFIDNCTRMNCTENGLQLLNNQCQINFNQSNFINSPYCVLSEWSDWSECDKECDIGKTKRYRFYLSGNISSCHDHIEDTKDCNTHCCKINGKWSQWGEWSNCSSDSCNIGFRKKTRRCDSPSPQCNGSPCEGFDSVTEPCILNKCNLIFFKKISILKLFF